MSRTPSKVEAITKIVRKLRTLHPLTHQEGLFVKDPSTDLFLLVQWDEFPLDRLDKIKKALRLGEDFTIDKRQYIDAEKLLRTVIGVAFASDELLPEYGLEMHPDGHVTPLKQ